MLCVPLKRAVLNRDDGSRDLRKQTIETLLKTKDIMMFHIYMPTYGAKPEMRTISFKYHKLFWRSSRQSSHGQGVAK